MTSFNVGPPATPTPEINYRIVQPVPDGPVEVYYLTPGSDMYIGQSKTFEGAVKIASDHSKRA
jgi:hypothetical protein